MGCMELEVEEGCRGLVAVGPCRELVAGEEQSFVEAPGHRSSSETGELGWVWEMFLDEEPLGEADSAELGAPEYVLE